MFTFEIRKARPLFDRKFDKFIDLHVNKCYCKPEICEKSKSTHKAVKRGFRLHFWKWTVYLDKTPKDCKSPV